MDLLNRLTLKNLILNKKRTIVTIIGIMLSVALITAVASMYLSAIRALIKFEIRQKGDFHVAFFDVPTEDIATFKNNRKIETVNLVQNMGYAAIDTQNAAKPYAYIKGFTKNSINNLTVNLVEGRFPESDEEILIPTHLRTNGRLVLNVGDEITLNVGKRVTIDGYNLDQSNPYQFSSDDPEFGELLVDTVAKKYKIVGIIERPASSIESYSAPGYTFITYIDEGKVSDVADVYVKYINNDVKNSYKISANILGVDEELFKKIKLGSDSITDEEYDKYFEDAKYDININSYLIGLETDPIKTSGVDGLGVVVAIVMAIIVFTSVFCIKNSFDISITEKIKQYGMLRSIGATKKQIKKNVFYEATILGFIGIPLGILLGLLASFILIIVSNHLLINAISEDFSLEFVFSYVAIIIATLLGIITIYFSAFKSAKRASKVSPIDSIRNSASIKINSKKIKSPKIIKKIFGIGGEISFKNLKRNKKKYRTTVISVIVSVLIFIALSSFMNLAFDTVENELKISEFNVSLYSSSLDDSNYDKYLATTKLDNIEDCTILRQLSITFKRNLHFNKEYINWLNLQLNDVMENDMSYSNFYTLGDEQYKKYIKNLGLNYDEIKDKIILIDYQKVAKVLEGAKEPEYKTMRIYDYQVGDKLDVTIYDEEYNIEIGYVTDIRPFGLKDRQDVCFIASDEIYKKFIPNKVLRIVYKSNDANKLQDDIDEILKSENYNLSNLEENVKMMNSLFTLIGIFLYGFVIVISLIGITNIFNTITTNMELRKQEFAMLKSIGMTNEEFKRMIRLESIFMGAKSLFFGVPVGIGLSYLIYHFLSEDSGLPYKLPVMSILIAIFAVFLLITSLMRYSMNKINKQNTIETIRNENI